MRSRVLLRMVLTAVVATFAFTGVAQAGMCPGTPVSQPFLPWGDSAYYTLVPGGGFESDMAAWSLTGASVVEGNETFFLNRASDTRSLHVKAGSVSISPSFCVSSEHPTLRLMARKLTAKTGQLKVEIVYRTSDGGTKVSLSGHVAHSSKGGDYHAAWRPSPILELGTALPLSSLGGTASVQLRVTADRGGEWLVDDVFADPRMR